MNENPATHAGMNDKTTGVSGQTSRREFLGLSATATGAAAVLGVSGVSNLLASSPGELSRATTKLPLKIAGYRLDRVEALRDGRVEVKGCLTQFAPVIQPRSRQRIRRTSAVVDQSLAQAIGKRR